ncbi:MAG: ribosome assembly cofactor RimP [Zetaproteobacteria bacterium]|nr:ribosome assembly cofactor RimP [Zetaproteobacteria bacterium]
MSLEDQVQQLATPIANELSIEILNVVMDGGSRSRLVKVIVDRRGGVSSDELVRISRGLSLQMDVEDVVVGKYHLEVTTPGFDWHLQNQADFDRYLGDWLKIVQENPPAIEGENLGLDGDAFSVRDEKGVVHRFGVKDVVKVTRAINWKAISKAQKKK